MLFGLQPKRFSTVLGIVEPEPSTTAAKELYKQQQVVERKKKSQMPVY